MNSYRNILASMLLVICGISYSNESFASHRKKDKKKENSKKHLREDKQKQGNSDIIDFGKTIEELRTRSRIRQEEQRVKNLKHQRAAEAIKSVFLTAVQNSDRELVETLLEGNDSLFYVQDKAGMSAFHLAAKNNDAAMVQLLCDAYGDLAQAYTDVVLGLVNHEGDTAEDVAISNNSKDAGIILSELKEAWNEAQQAKAEALRRLHALFGLD